VARWRGTFAVGAGSGLAGVLIALVLLAPATAVAETEAAKTVLLLYAESRLLPGVVVVDQELRSALESGSAGPIRFHTEYLDLSWFRDTGIEPAAVEFLRRKYAGHALDLVIPAGPTALRFALRNRAAIFPRVPMVFTAGLRSMVADIDLPSDVTGTWLVADWPVNLDLILRLQPDTRRVVLVYGTSPFDRAEVGGVSESEDRFRLVADSHP